MKEICIQDKFSNHYSKRSALWSFIILCTDSETEKYMLIPTPNLIYIQWTDHQKHMKHNPPKWLERVWAQRGAFEAHILSRDRSLAGLLSAPHLLAPYKPVWEEGPPLLTCQLQRACLLLPQSFDTKIVQEVSVLKLPQQALILGIEWVKRNKERLRKENK